MNYRLRQAGIKIAFVASSRCCSCTECQCLLTKKKDKLCKCSHQECFYFSSKTHKCYVGIHELRKIVSENIIVKWIANYVRLDVIKMSIDDVVEIGLCFDDRLERVQKIVHNLLVQNAPSSLITIPNQNLICMNEIISDIRGKISEVSDIVNEIDMSPLTIPREIEDLQKVFYRSFNIKRAGATLHLSLEELKYISTLKDNLLGNNKFSLICQIQSMIKEYSTELSKIKSGIEEFNEWVHDMGHYLVQIDGVLPIMSSQIVQIPRDSLHTLDALLCGVGNLKIGLMLSISEGYYTSSYFGMIDGESYYEPYKVFHKMRYCYGGEGIAWTDGPEKFRGKVKAVKGIEFVAMNIYSNAVKYLRDYKGEKNVKTSFVQRQDGLEILVESFGPRITHEELKRIGHEPFRGMAAQNYKGSGRGLYRVAKICSALGYELQVKSGPVDKEYQEYALFGVQILIPKKYQQSCYEPSSAN